uniref:Secreted protein n=1 Tax=Heterorhabditis bacteriophora TaxID=37862 RepID=A0A1I7WBJ8_HETBA
MLRSGSFIWARVCFRATVSNSSGCFHTSTSSLSLLKAKPHEDEMPVLEAASISARPHLVIDLGKKRLRRKEMNIVGKFI